MPESPLAKANGPVKLTIKAGDKKVAGTVGIVGIEVIKAVGKIPFARIELQDGDMESGKFPVSDSDDFKPGAEIEIKAGYGAADEETIFKGIVVRHGLKISGENRSTLLVECRDKAVVMTVGRKNANFVDSTDSAIISKLVTSYTAPMLSAEVTATSASHKEIVQYYCTDWDLLLSRAEINGYLVTVEDGKVSACPPKTEGDAALKVTWGDAIIAFQAEIDAVSQFPKVTAASWDLKTQLAVESEAAPQDLTAIAGVGNALAKVVGAAAFHLQTVAPLDKSVLEAWAKGCQVKAGLARTRGTMKFCGSALAKPATLIQLDKVGTRFEGNAIIGSVRHEIRDGEWTTEVEFGLSPDWFAEKRDLVSPPAAGMLPGVEGLQIGVVKKLDEDPDGQHKVQVSIPLMKAETDGVWARLAGYYASNGVGAFFVPEVGDEVVLGYFNNDPSHPVILGSLYSSKLAPPYSLTADNFKKALVTKSKLTLEFDDEKKVITIVTPAKNQVVISDEGKSILLQDQNENKVVLSADGVVIDSPKDVKISAKGKVSIDAVGEIAVTSKADLKLGGLNVNHTAQVGFVAKGSASAELSASGQTTVKGAMVMIN